jgi:hypothetical protein
MSESFKANPILDICANVITVTVCKSQIVYFGAVHCSLDFSSDLIPRKRLMVVHLKTYPLYFYFKALKTIAGSMPAEKRSGMSGWFSRLASRVNKDTHAEPISSRNGHA